MKMKKGSGKAVGQSLQGPGKDLRKVTVRGQQMKPSQPANNHLTPQKHPFHVEGGWKNSRPMAKTVGVGSRPGGEGNLESANAAMTKRSKGGMMGPGEAG